MSVLDNVPVELRVVLGSIQLPIRQILKLSRGAMIAFDGEQDDPTLVYVNDALVAKGRIEVSGDRMSIVVTEVVPSGASA